MAEKLRLPEAVEGIEREMKSVSLEMQENHLKQVAAITESVAFTDELEALEKVGRVSPIKKMLLSRQAAAATARGNHAFQTNLRLSQRYQALATTLAALKNPPKRGG